MNECHSCARRAIEASDATCTLIDKSWADCALTKRKHERYRVDGFISEYKFFSAKQAAKAHTAAGIALFPQMTTLTLFLRHF